eukprot:sb/3471361/
MEKYDDISIVRGWHTRHHLLVQLCLVVILFGIVYQLTCRRGGVVSEASRSDSTHHYGVNSGQLARCRVYGLRTRNRALNLDPVARFTHKIGAGKRFFGINMAKSQSSRVGTFLEREREREGEREGGTHRFGSLVLKLSHPNICSTLGLNIASLWGQFRSAREMPCLWPQNAQQSSKSRPRCAFYT